MLQRAHRWLRLDRLERRLFGWLLLLTLVPTFTLLTIGYAVGARSLEWVGTFGQAPWERAAESGRALIDAAGPAAAGDTALANAIDRHGRELSSSVVLARRWNFLGDRLRTLLPLLAIALAIVLTTLALWVGRRLSVQLARPIKELAGWAELLPGGQTLPAQTSKEADEVREVRALREAMRLASVRIQEARARDLEAQRVRAWGEMARRVAHEMKNPLTPLRLAAHRLSRHPDAHSGLREPLEVIDEETTRLEELARQFAVLGRPSAGPASDVDLRELMERLLESDVPPRIATRLQVSPDVPLMHAHYDALQRAFRNLVRNAVEAIDEARETDATSASEIHVSIAREGAFVRIVIGDTGCGIPPDRVDRLFEPDFTLKAGGTGLGLAVVRQAVAAHAGEVWARPRAGGGAEFTVLLPVRLPAPPQ
jgi:two-component system nitrogen regulation sensor histidine kinase NtrY